MTAIVFGALELRARARHPQVGFRGMSNSLGFRSPEFDPTKAAGVTRILFIGSSTTFGVTGPVEKTFPYLVGEILRRDMPGNRIETINAAMPGKTSYWEVERIKETRYLEPNIVVVMTGYNDSASIHRDFVRINERGDLILTPWLYRVETWIARHSVFYVTLKEKLAVLLYADPNRAYGNPVQNEKWGTDSAQQEWFQHYPRHFRTNLEQMIELASENGAKLVFIKGPLSTQRKEMHPRYAHAYSRLMEELASVCSQHEIPLIELDQAFPTFKETEYLARDGLHFTDEGNQAIAEVVSEFFIQNRINYFRGSTLSK